MRFIVLPILGAVGLFFFGGEETPLLHKLGFGAGGGLAVAIGWKYFLGELLKMGGGFRP